MRDDLKLVPIADLRANVRKWIAYVLKHNRPIIITRYGKPCAILQPYDVEALKAALPPTKE